MRRRRKIGLRARGPLLIRFCKITKEASDNLVRGLLRQPSQLGGTCPIAFGCAWHTNSRLGTAEAFLSFHLLTDKNGPALSEWEDGPSSKGIVAMNLKRWETLPVPMEIDVVGASGHRSYLPGVGCQHLALTIGRTLFCDSNRPALWADFSHCQGRRKAICQMDKINTHFRTPSPEDCLALAMEAEANAAATDLPNVREKHLKTAQRWRQLASKPQKKRTVLRNDC